MASVKKFGSQADLARAVGLSKAGISKARKAGRFNAAIQRDGTIDLKLAAKLLARNTTRPTGTLANNLNEAKRSFKLAQIDRLQRDVEELEGRSIEVAEGCAVLDRILIAPAKLGYLGLAARLAPRLAASRDLTERIVIMREVTRQLENDIADECEFADKAEAKSAKAWPSEPKMKFSEDAPLAELDAARVRLADQKAKLTDAIRRRDRISQEELVERAIDQVLQARGRVRGLLDELELYTQRFPGDAERIGDGIRLVVEDICSQLDRWFAESHWPGA